MEGKPLRSSSPERAGAVDAVVWSEKGAAGPVRLPGRDAAEFIAEFNKTYRTLGWKLSPVEEEGRATGEPHR